MKGSKIRFKFTSLSCVFKNSSLYPVCVFLASADEVECEMSDIVLVVTNFRKHQKKVFIEGKDYTGEKKM